MVVTTACRRLILGSGNLDFMPYFRLKCSLISQQSVLHAILIGQSEVAG